MVDSKVTVINSTFVSMKIGLAATYEQLAEECSELAQAALKMARLIRNENPTPKTYEECLDAVNEEAADVKLVLDVLELSCEAGTISGEKVAEIEVEKMHRWLKRLGDEV